MTLSCGNEPEASTEAHSQLCKETGYQGSLFSGTSYDKEDLEADAIYAGIDAKMAERRQEQREAREKEELAKYRRERPKIQQQFSDLKETLSVVSEAEWDAIPDVGELRQKKKARHADTYTAMPDSMLSRTLEKQQMSTELSDIGATSRGGGACRH